MMITVGYSSPPSAPAHMVSISKLRVTLSWPRRCITLVRLQHPQHTTTHHNTTHAHTTAIMLQAEDRVYRLGQKRDVFIYYLQSQTSQGGDTVEHLVFDILDKKRKMIRETIEGGALDLESLKANMYSPMTM